jgi:hypothetical protein
LNNKDAVVKILKPGKLHEIFNNKLFDSEAVEDKARDYDIGATEKLSPHSAVTGLGL